VVSFDLAAHPDGQGSLTVLSSGDKLPAQNIAGSQEDELFYSDSDFPEELRQQTHACEHLIKGNNPERSFAKS